MMEKLIFLALVLILLAPSGTSAQQQCGPEGEGYRLCVPLPGQPDTVANFGEYVKLLYQFALAVAGIVVFARIVYGGIMYTLSAGNIVGQGEAKSIITQAIYGLILLFMATLILWIVNPNLLIIGRNVRSAPATGGKIPNVLNPEIR